MVNKQLIKEEKWLLCECFCIKSNMKSFETPLHAAVHTCNIDWTRQLLMRGACVNVIDQHGKTLLHCAIDLDHFDMIKLLLKANIDINAKYISQFRPLLHYAVENNRFIAVDLLLKAGARIDICEKDRILPLRLVMPKNHMNDYLRLLRNRGSTNTKENILFYPATHLAAIHGFYRLYWLMFSKYNISVNLRDQTCSTFLHYAVKRGDLEEVKRLVSGGADVNLLDNNNWNVLQYAVQSDLTSLAVYLLENGTIENTQCLQKDKPLYLAAFSRHTQMLKRLIFIDGFADRQLLWDIVLRSSIVNNDRNNIICALEMGAKLDSFSTQLEKSIIKVGLAALHLAAQKSTIDELHILLNSPNVNVNILDNNNWTPLHHCVFYNRLDIFNALVDHYHADINALTNDSENVFLLALSCDHIHLAKSILKRRIKLDLNRVYTKNKTLLEHAIIRKAPVVVQLLLDMGANPNFPIDIDIFPLRLAIDSGSVEIVQSLINKGVNIYRLFTLFEPDKGPYYQINDTFTVCYQEWSMFSYVVFQCKSKIIRYFIEESKSIDLHWQTDTQIINAFAKGISMNLVNNSQDIFETFNILLKAGYNLHIQNELTGKYPIHVICELITSSIKDNELALELILLFNEFKANINAKDSFHRTPLHIIASSEDSHPDLYQTLLKLGANKYSLDIDGHTPEDISMMHQQNKIVSLFSLEKLPFKNKFYFLSPRILLTKNDLTKLLNNNAQIRKLLPYTTKKLKQIQIIEETYIIKELETIDDKHCLNEYLGNLVSKRTIYFRENSEELQIRDTIQHLLNDLVIEIIRIDDRFSDSQLIASGSAFQRSKIEKPDEFDFLFEFGKNDFIVEKTIQFIQTNVPCYVKIVVNDIEIQSKWKDFIDEDKNFLNTSKLRLYIVLLMQQASFTNTFRSQWWQHEYLRFNLVPYHEKCLNCATFINQSRVGGILYVEWNGIKYEKLHISIDIVPAIPILNHWPSNAYKHSLPVLGIDDLTQWGYHVITKADSNLCNMFVWRTSFSLCEYHIFSRLNSCQSNCFAILKLICTPFEDSLTSWMLKSMFFHQLKIPLECHWDIEQLSERVNDCLSCIWPDEFAPQPNDVQSFFIENQIIHPTDATSGYNVNNIVLALHCLRIIKKQLIRILTST